MANTFELKALITGVDRLSPTLNGIRKKIAGFRKGLKADGLGELGLRDVLAGGALATPLIQATRAAIDFESSMADVRKVVNFDTPQQFRQMGRDIMNLSVHLPMAASEIAQIVAAGGQAGIGRSELAQFADDAVKMGVAFDLTADQAGDMMAKWRTAFGMGQQQVVELADKINYLDNVANAKAAKVSDVVTRVGPLAQVAGVAAGQVAALGATLVGVGVQQDVAATGIKDFLLTLSAGSAATKQQQQMFKALRLNAKQVATGMQHDAQHTMLHILKAISQVKPDRQAAVLQKLFGRESIEAIAPLLTNLSLLKTNFNRVGDATLYAHSMQQEYARRAATTANNLQLLRNRAARIGLVVGTVVLPALNQFLATLGPLASHVATLASAHPGWIKGLIGAAAGFMALRLAVAATTTGMKLFTAVTSLTPIGIAVRVLALAAGLLIANWQRIGPFFRRVWTGIKTAVLSFAPLHALIAHWGPIVDFMSALWGAVKIVVAKDWDGLKALFLKFTPLGLIVKNWEPVVAWFARLWDRVKPYVAPLLDGASALAGKLGIKLNGSVDDTLHSAATSLRRWTAAQPPASARDGHGSPARLPAGRPRLQAEVNVHFQNAPPGLRTGRVKTSHPGLTVTPRVGYRSLAGVS